MEKQFKHFELKLVEPSFSSHLTDLIVQLDGLRKKRLGGTTNPNTFFQLKNIFHTLESIGSARIEGNRTTITEYIETKIAQEKISDENILEIKNMEEAMEFIDQNVHNHSIDRSFISELHKMVVKELSFEREGDKTPGEYRMAPVSIAGSSHKPPDYVHVSSYMNELFMFINHEFSPKYDLLKTAIAHHRFTWIHPFRNGNGRTVRLLTYAMLVKQGFNVNIGRIVNPTAVFCNNRNKYYHFLSLADTGQDEGMLQWCEYVLNGLKTEVEKIDKLLDYQFLAFEILLPALKLSLERKVITDHEEKILRIAVNKQLFQAADVKPSFQGKLAPEISRMLRRLKEKRIIASEKENSRKYFINFSNSYLLRDIITMLGNNNFLPIKDNPPSQEI